MTLSRPMLERPMPHYAALDVSNEETAIHVVDEAGRTVWRGKRASDPEALATALRVGRAVVSAGARGYLLKADANNHLRVCWAGPEQVAVFRSPG